MRSQGTDMDFEMTEVPGEHQVYKVYKRRWLVLLASFTLSLVGQLHRSLISIADIIDEDLGISIEQFGYLAQVCSYTSVLSLLGVARALDCFGLRRSAYVGCTFLAIANCLKALCFMDARVLPTWLVAHRYALLLVSEVLLGLYYSISNCIPAKVANSWFPQHESTLAIGVPYIGANIGIGLSNLLTPWFVQSSVDMYKLTYMFFISGALVVLITLTCIQRSSPKIPPSSMAVESAGTKTSLKSSLMVMLSQPSFLLVLLTYSFNISVTTAYVTFLEDIMRAQNYSNKFCGLLIAQNYLFGTFFLFIGAIWIDKSSNYINLSRYIVMIVAAAFVGFFLSIIRPDNQYIILVANTLNSFGGSLMCLAIIQVAIRSASTILPEATVMATLKVPMQMLTAILINFIALTRRLSPAYNTYLVPMVALSILAIAINHTYAAFFKFPSREELQSKLRARTGGKTHEEV